jgi:hypothetical protein
VAFSLNPRGVDSQANRLRVRAVSPKPSVLTYAVFVHHQAFGIGGSIPTLSRCTLCGRGTASGFLVML